MYCGWLAKTSGVVAVMVCLAGTQVAESALIVGYSGTQTPVEQTGAGVTNAGLTRGPGVTQGGSTVYETKDWTTGASPSATDYVQFGWTASPGWGFDLTSLEIQYRRTGSGPTALQIQIQVNNGSFVTFFTDNTVIVQGEFQNIDLSAYNGVTSAIFRIFAYNARNGSGQLDLYNFETGPPAFAIRIGGVTATPEPTSLAVFGLGAMVAGYTGWRRRKATAPQKT